MALSEQEERLRKTESTKRKEKEGNENKEKREILKHSVIASSVKQVEKE